MSKRFWYEAFVTAVLLLLFVGILALIGEIRYRDALRENTELKSKLTHK